MKKIKMTEYVIRNRLTRAAIHRAIIAVCVPMAAIGVHADNLFGFIMAIVAVVILCIVSAEDLVEAVNLNEEKEDAQKKAEQKVEVVSLKAKLAERKRKNAEKKKLKAAGMTKKEYELYMIILQAEKELDQTMDTMEKEWKEFERQRETDKLLFDQYQYIYNNNRKEKPTEGIFTIPFDEPVGKKEKPTK